MTLYPNVLRHLLMPCYEFFKGKNLLHNINDYQSHLLWSPEQLEQFQWTKLKLLLSHAYNNSPYYRRTWQELGITSIDDIKTKSDFYQLPIVTKDNIRTHYNEFLATNFTDNIKKSTGGSTGQPFSFELNIDSNTRREAVMWRGYNWLGAGLGVKTLYLWGADLGNPSKAKTIKNSLYNKFYNRKMLNSFAMSKHNMSSYISDINNYKPTAIVSYVNPLYTLAKYILENNLSIFSPESILTGAEPLHDFQRKLIEKAFNTQVYNTFGCREFMLMSAECKQNKNLHINSDHLVIETLSDTGDSITEESGDLIITDLYNYGMPLIRYANGDRATLVDEPCSCGNPLPLMQSIDGRKLDIIKTPSGKIIPGELFPHLFKEYSGISRFQVKQSKLDELQIVMITNNDFTDDDKRSIEREINKYASNELTLIFNLVDDIPLTASGKHRVTICDV